MPPARARRAVLDALPKGGTGAEIGVWQGDFAAAILDVARPRLLYLIDPWAVSTDEAHRDAWYGAPQQPDMEAICTQVQARFASEIDLGTVQIKRATSAEALRDLPDAALDFVYIDGDHRYEVVLADIMLAVSKVRPAGLIALDDHVIGGWWGDSVVRAVNDALGACSSVLHVRFALHDQIVLQRQPAT